MELLIIYYQVLKGGCQRKLLNEENKYLINPFTRLSFIVRSHSLLVVIHYGTKYY